MIYGTVVCNLGKKGWGFEFWSQGDGGSPPVLDSGFFGPRVAFVPDFSPTCTQRNASVRAVMAPPQRQQQRSPASSGIVSPSQLWWTKSHKSFQCF